MNTSTTTVANVDALEKPQRLKIESFPDQPSAGKTSPPATLPNFEHLLASYDLTLRNNVISKKPEILLKRKVLSDAGALPVIQSFAELNGFKTNLLPSYMGKVAEDHAFNPVAMWIDSKPWDGKDRLHEVFATLVQRDDYPHHLKCTLIRKWLLSAVAAAMKASGFNSRGVLTLQGPQSIGKTSWIRSLINDAALSQSVIKLDHHLDAANKDAILTAVGHWIVEIGELDSSFKKDIARLKGFITASVDKVRKPYGHIDSEMPRRTVFCASVNDNNFLIDPTGNTRFWTIAVTSINAHHDIDMQQVFAQLAGDFRAGAEWWLTQEEEQLLEAQNGDHLVASALEERILDVVDLSSITITRMKAGDMLKLVGIDNASNQQQRECGAILRKLFGDPKKNQGVIKWPVKLKIEKLNLHSDLKHDHQMVDEINSKLRELVDFDSI